LRSRWTLAAALLITIACNPFPNPGPPPASQLPSAYHPTRPAHRGGTLVLGDWEFPQTLDVYAAATDADFRAAALTSSPLWGLDSGLQPYPDLVREVPTLENGDVKVAADGSMTVDVKLLPGLRWSDGEPLTAGDLIYTWQAHAAAFDRIRSMDRKSDTEVVWSFSAVYAPYLQIGPQFWVEPQHRPHQPDVVSGPFMVSAQTAGQSITYVANPHYPDGRQGYFGHAPYLDRIVYRAYPSKTALLAGLRSGESDLGFNLGTDDLHDLQGIGGSEPLVFRGLRTEFLNPNHAANTATGKAPPWVTPGGDDRRLLDALDRGADREALVLSALGGYGKPSRALFPSAMRGWSDQSGPGPGRDLEGARRLLDDDGWKPGADGVRVKDGQRLEFQLVAACSTLAANRELAILKQQWQELGAAVDTGCRARTAFFGTTNPSGGFDMTVYSNAWVPDPSAWSAFGESGANWNRCRDPELDRALAAGETTLDAGKRQAAYLSLQREWLAYHCTMTLFEWPEVRQVAATLHNYVPSGGSDVDVWNAADWWLS